MAGNTNDWRSQEPDLRQRFFHIIYGKLKKWLPHYCHNVITQMAGKMEEKIYGIAKDKNDYVLKIVENLNLAKGKCRMMQSSYSVNATSTQDSGAQLVLNPGQSVPTQTPTSQQWLPQQNINFSAASQRQQFLPPQQTMPGSQSGAQLVLNPGQSVPTSLPQKLLPQHLIDEKNVKEIMRHGNLKPPHMQQQAQPQPQKHLQSLSKTDILMAGNTNDWRSQHEPDLRKRVFDIIYDKLKIWLPRYSHNVIAHIAGTMEEKIYGIAKDEDDYARKIEAELNLTEQKCKMIQSLSAVNATNTQDSGTQLVLNPGQSVPTQTPTSQQNINFSAASQRQQLLPPQQTMPGSQSGQSVPIQTPTSQQNINFSAASQRQQLLPPQQTMLGSQSGQSVPTLTPTRLQWLPQQNINLSAASQKQQLLPPQQTMPGSQSGAQLVLNLGQSVPTQRQLLLANLAQHLKNEQMIKELTHRVNMQRQAHQHLQSMLKQPIHQSFPQSSIFPSLPSSSNQNSQLVPSQNIGTFRPSYQAMAPHNNLQTMHQHQQRMLGSQSAAQDWQEETYQRITALKEKHLSILTHMLLKHREILQQPESLPPQMMQSGLTESLWKNILLIEQILDFLQVHRSNISEKHRDMFSLYEEKILIITEGPMQQQQEQFPPSQTNQTALQSQLNVLQSLETDQINSWLTPSNLNRTLTSVSGLIDYSSNQGQLLNAVASGSASSTQLVDQHILPTTVNETAIPSQSIGSPFVGPSPMTSLTPSSFPGDPENPIPDESPVSHSQSPSFGVESSTPEQPPKPIAEQPIDGLTKAFQSSSPGSCQSVGGSRVRSREDFSASTSPNKRMKRSINAMPLENSIDSEVNKIESNCVLIEEIKEINSKLVETMVKICNKDAESGTIIMCSYTPVDFNGQILQIQPLGLLVPENYPNSSPTVLNELPFDANSDNYEDLSARTRSKFSLSLKELSKPLSLNQIAQAWNDSARATMDEYATRHGYHT